MSSCCESQLRHDEAERPPALGTRATVPHCQLGGWEDAASLLSAAQLAGMSSVRTAGYLIPNTDNITARAKIERKFHNHREGLGLLLIENADNKTMVIRCVGNPIFTPTYLFSKGESSFPQWTHVM